MMPSNNNANYMLITPTSAPVCQDTIKTSSLTVMSNATFMEALSTFQLVRDTQTCGTQVDSSTAVELGYNRATSSQTEKKPIANAATNTKEPDVSSIKTQTVVVKTANASTNANVKTVDSETKMDGKPYEVQNIGVNTMPPKKRMVRASVKKSQVEQNTGRRSCSNDRRTKDINNRRNIDDTKLWRRSSSNEPRIKRSSSTSSEKGRNKTTTIDSKFVPQRRSCSAEKSEYPKYIFKGVEYIATEPSKKNVLKRVKWNSFAKDGAREKNKMPTGKNGKKFLTPSVSSTSKNKEEKSKISNKQNKPMKCLNYHLNKLLSLISCDITKSYLKHIIALVNKFMMEEASEVFAYDNEKFEELKQTSKWKLAFSHKNQILNDDDDDDDGIIKSITEKGNHVMVVHSLEKKILQLEENKIKPSNEHVEKQKSQEEERKSSTEDARERRSSFQDARWHHRCLKSSEGDTREKSSPTPDTSELRSPTNDARKNPSRQPSRDCTREQRSRTQDTRERKSSTGDVREHPGRRSFGEDTKKRKSSSEDASMTTTNQSEIVNKEIRKEDNDRTKDGGIADICTTSANLTSANSNEGTRKVVPAGIVYPNIRKHQCQSRRSSAKRRRMEFQRRKQTEDIQSLLDINTSSQPNNQGRFNTEYQNSYPRKYYENRKNGKLSRHASAEKYNISTVRITERRNPNHSTFYTEYPEVPAPCYNQLTVDQYYQQQREWMGDNQATFSHPQHGYW